MYVFWVSIPTRQILILLVGDRPDRSIESVSNWRPGKPKASVIDKLRMRLKKQISHKNRTFKLWSRGYGSQALEFDIRLAVTVGIGRGRLEWVY